MDKEKAIRHGLDILGYEAIRDNQRQVVFHYASGQMCFVVCRLAVGNHLPHPQPSLVPGLTRSG